MPDGTLAQIQLTATEIAYLQSFLDAGDRPGFYMAYYAMVEGDNSYFQSASDIGKDEASLQAKISSFSGAVGAAAFLSNRLLQQMDSKYPGIYTLSQQVAQHALDKIESNDNRFVSDAQFFDSAEQAWKDALDKDGNAVLIKDFPGLLLENGVEGLVWESATVVANLLAFALSTQANTGALPDRAALIDWLRTNGGDRVGEWVAALAGIYVNAAEVPGKDVDAFSADSGYAIVESVDGEQRMAVDSNGHVVAVELDDSKLLPSGKSKYEAMNSNIDSIIDLAMAASPIVIPGVGGGKATLAAILSPIFGGAIDWSHLSYPIGDDPAYNPASTNFGATPTPHRSTATTGNDTISGTTADVLGFGGNDIIHALEGNDVVFGGTGTDQLFGDAGDDILWGQGGDDTLDGGSGSNILRGGEGYDTAVLNTGSVDIRFADGLGVDDPSIAEATAVVGTAGAAAYAVDQIWGAEKFRLSDHDDTVTFGKLGDPTGAGSGVTIDFAGTLAGRDGQQQPFHFNDDLLDLSASGTAVVKHVGDTDVTTNYGVRVDLRNTNNQTVQYLSNSASTTVTGGALTGFYAGLFGRSDVMVTVQNANSVIGTQYNDVLIGNAGKKEDAEGYSTLHGGQGNDFLAGRGWESHLYGDSGKDEFSIGSNTWIEDGEVGDTVDWGIRLYGGVNQWWQESGTAYWAPMSALSAAFPVIGAELLYTAAFFIDQVTMKFAQYKLDDQGNLLINLWGQTASAVVKDYSLDLNSGVGTAGITVFSAGHGTSTASLGKNPEQSPFTRYVNLALKAGFGVGLHGVDPLVLDLNGDGYNLVAQSVSGVHFEFDNDGFGERTGWVRPTDGFLVRDANANGKIDNVTEMFGNASANGFDVLAGYDDNLDGAITAADNVYAQLQVWQDSNQNGVTDAGELKSLADLGIVSISLTHSAPTDPTSVGGNVITHVGSFTRSDGSIGHLANVVLDTDETDSKWLGDTTVDSVAATLPELAGSGELRDLRIAMSHDSTLETSVAAFVANTSADLSTLKAAAEQILYRWAGVDGVAATAIGGDGFDARKLAFLEKASGYQLMPRDGNGVIALDNLDEVERLWSDQLTRLTLRLVVQGPMADAFAGLTYRADLDLLVANGPNALADLLHNIILDLPADAAAAAAQWSDWAPLLGAVSEGMVRSDGNVVRSDYLFTQLLRAVDGVAQPLSLQQLADGLHIADVRIGTSTNDTLARGTAGETAIYYGDGGDDTFNGGTGQDVYVFGHQIGHATINDVEPNPAGDRIRFAFLSQGDVTLARDGNDLLITVTASGETIRVTGQFAPVVPLGSDVLLSSDKGIEDIQFADGSIMEIPEIMAAVGRGTDGDDHLVGTMHSDVLTAGKGDDLVEGGDDADLYVFNRGDGNDVYRDWQTTPLLRAADLVVFGDDIAPGDLTYTRTGTNGDDLLITVANGGGSITIQGQFAYTSLGYNAALAPNSRIEAFAFRNYGDAFSNRDLQQQLIAQDTTDGNDVTRGFGDDDTFVASAGNDVLIGMDGADTYNWGAGAGNDIIREQAQYIDINVGLGGISLTVRADVVRFDPSISPSSLIFSRNYDTDDLVITNTTTGETLTVDGQFNSFQTGVLGPQWFDRVEWFAFADNSAYSWQDVEAMVTTGSAGNDRLRGDILADHMVGGRGDDLLSGGGGGDTYVFNAGDGHDTVFDDNWTLIGDGFLTADQTIDTVQLGDGIDPDDVAFTRNGSAITLTFGSSGDAITLQGQDDYVQTGVFGAIPTNRIEQVVFHDGTVWTWQDINQKMIAAQTTVGDDITEGFTLSDRFEKSAGDDIMRGGDSSDTYVFGVGAGHDRIEESVSNVLYGDDDSVEFDNTVAVADVSVARDGNDLILSLTSGDSLRVAGEFELQTLYTWRDVENFRFADGTGWSKADLQRKLLQSTSGDDHLVGFYSSDDLDGGAGNDLLEGGDGSDTYHFDRGYGNDEIRESVTEVNVGDFDQVVFGPTLLPEDLTVARDGNDLVLTVADTGETLRVTGQFNFGSWFAWNDVELFKFANGTQWTDIDIAARLTGGTSGDDHLVGTFRSDTLDGKEGNDLLEGGDGSDIYLFGRGYGHDEIRESLTDANLGEDDEVRFGANISLADLGFTRNGDNLVISIAGTDDTLTLTGEFTYSFPYTWNDVERFTFADGSFITKADVSQMVLAGTPGNDHIIGFGSDDTLDGGAGDDVLEGMDGSDTYRFGVGDGHDTVHEILTDGRTTEFDTLAFKDGVLPTDVTVTREGQDAIFTLSSGDTIRVVGQFNYGYNEFLSFNDIEQATFADGTVWSKADILLKVLQGTPGDDILIGGPGSDVLDGGAGNDRLEGSEGSDTYVWGTGYGNDTIHETFDLILRPEEDRLNIKGVDPDDLAIARSGNDIILTIPSGETLTIEGQLLSDGRHDIDEFAFDDGTVWDLGTINAQILLQQATPGNDSINGFAGDDYLFGGAGNDDLNGSDGNDVLDGGAGDDLLRGDIGNDTYRFGIGGGHDTIDDHRNGWAMGEDTIEFAAGVTQADVAVTRDVDDLVLTITATGDSIRIAGGAVETGAMSREIEHVHFADGSSWTSAELRAFALGATMGNDSIVGSDAAETIDGLAGNDLIEARGGNDIVSGGVGNDTLAGEDGDDTYRYALGDGDDVINDNIHGWGGYHGFDTVDFAAGIAPADIRISVQNGDFLVGFDGAPGSLRLVGSASQTNSAIERITFSDGTIWTYADIVARSLVASTGADSLYGGNYDDVINGLAGDDFIDGHGGNDDITGGAGDDVMAGQGGDDTYRYGLGDGDDTIDDNIEGNNGNQGFDTLVLGAGITVANTEVSVSSNGRDFKLSFDGGSGSVALAGTAAQSSGSVDQVVFADGTIWTYADLQSRVVTNPAMVVGTNRNDSLYGGDGAQTLIGKQGNDNLEGRNGGDEYRYASGDGNDWINEQGSVGDVDTLKLTDLNPADITLSRDGVHLYVNVTATGQRIGVNNQFWDGHPEYGIEQIVFADGATWDRNRISRDAPIVGGNGDDGLYGTSLDDTLIGHAGNDYLEGRGGSDTYRYASGDGFDTIRDNGAATDVDVLALSDLNPGQVELRREGDELYILDIGAGKDIHVISQFQADGTAGLEQLSFADGTVWNREAIRQHAWIQGWYLNQPGNESLYGSSLDDTLAGHGGDDYLEGRDGSDTYRYASGDGNDRIYENGSTANTDTLQLTDLGPADVVLRRDGSDLYVADVATGQEIRVQNQFYSDQQYAIEQIKFADGTVWDRARITAETSAVRGTNVADFLNGSASADIIYGIGGDDLIYGAAGDDRVDGGDGADTLLGNDGDDTMIGGAGNDVINGDEPALVATGSNLVINGSFEDFGGTETYYSWGANIATMPGWVKATSAQYEAGRTYATEGSWYIDLEAYFQNMDISQTIAGLTQGSVYSLQFDSRNTGSAANGFELYWNGQLVAAVPNVPSTITTYSFSLVADGGANTLRFVSTGPVDNDGASLDNVQLHATAAAIVGNGADTLTGGAGDDVLYGGGGSDVAVYSGSSADYTVTSNQDGSYTVEDLIADRDGIDTLTSIETLRFSDGDFAPLDLSGGGQQAMRAMVRGSPAAVAAGIVDAKSADPSASEPGTFTWDDWTFGRAQGGRFGGLASDVNRAFDPPQAVVATGTLDHTHIPPSIGVSAAQLVEGMASFGAAPAGEFALDRRDPGVGGDLWMAHHRSGAGPVRPFDIAA